MTSLRLRLLAGAAAAIIAALVATGFALAFLFERHVERRIATELSVDLAQLIGALSVADGALAVSPRPPDPRFAVPRSGLYWQASRGEEPPIRSRSLWELALPDLPTSGEGPTLSTIPFAGSRIVALARTVVLAADAERVPIHAAVAIDRRELDEAVSGFVADMVPALVVLAFVLFAAGLVQIHVGLRPLGSLRSAIGAVRSGRARRLDAQGPAEVLPLAQTIDALLAEQEKALAQAKTRADDLAHGLKTPLQALTGIADRLRPVSARAADEVSAVAAVLRQRVERTLAVSRAESRAIAAEPVDVGSVVEKVVAVASHTPAGERLDIVCEGTATVLAHPSDLAELLGALVENAVRFARRTVRIAVVPGGGRAEIVIEDDGPGIPEAARRAVLARGKRLDETASGDGLGLAIAADLAEAYGGTLALEDAGPGLRVRVVLPAAG